MLPTRIHRDPCTFLNVQGVKQALHPGAHGDDALTIFRLSHLVLQDVLQNSRREILERVEHIVIVFLTETEDPVRDLSTVENHNADAKSSNWTTKNSALVDRKDHTGIRRMRPNCFSIFRHLVV